MALISLAVAAVGIPVTVWATRRWGSRRARVEIDLDVVPILPSERPEELAVTFRDFPVPDPHLITFRIRNIGPRDIASADFDGGEPLAVGFADAFYGVTRITGGRTIQPTIGARDDQAEVQLQPRLMKRGDVWGFTAVVSGGKTPQIHSPLIDTDLVQARAGEPHSLKVYAAGIGVEVPIPRRRRVFRA